MIYCSNMPRGRPRKAVTLSVAVGFKVTKEEYELLTLIQRPTESVAATMRRILMEAVELEANRVERENSAQKFKRLLNEKVTLK